MTTDSEAFRTATAFKVVIRILDQWQASREESMKLLGLKGDEFKSTCQAVKSGKPIALDEETLFRLSCILQIHQSLRVTFNNPENIYGFMKMANNNPFFEGRTPMQAATQDGLKGLCETLKRIESMNYI